MRKFFLWVGLFSLVASGANAASYQSVHWTIVDPIQNRWNGTVPGGDHAYAGANLEPNADLSYADLTDAYLYEANLIAANLTGADLNNADLRYADLTNADLYEANLIYADLTGVYLEGADLSYADLSGAHLHFTNWFAANLTGADLNNANLYDAYDLGYSTGSAYYNAETDFTNAWADSGSTLFDPVAAGWTFVPEPSTALLLGIGMMGLGMRRRRTHRRGL